MIDFSLIRIGLGVRLCDAFCDDFPVALFVTCEFTIGTLHSSGIFQKFSTKRATHDVVELLLDELVAILLVDFLLLLTNSTLTTKSKIEILLVFVLLDYTNISTA